MGCKEGLAMVCLMEVAMVCQWRLVAMVCQWRFVAMVCQWRFVAMVCLEKERFCCEVGKTF